MREFRFFQSIASRLKYGFKHRFSHGLGAGPVPAVSETSWAWRPWNRQSWAWCPWKPKLWPLVLALGTALWVGVAQPSLGQGILPWLPPSLNLGGETSQVSDRPQSNLAVGYVRLDGRNLFLVSAGTVESDEGWQPRMTPLQERIHTIETTLARFARSDFTAADLRLDYRILNNLPVVYGNDQPLVTVTAQDALLYGRDPEAQAQQIVEILHSAFLQSQREREPSFLWRQALISGLIGLGTVGLSLFVLLWQRHLNQRSQEITEEERKFQEMSQIWAETRSSDPQELDFTAIEHPNTDPDAPLTPTQTSLINAAQNGAEQRRLYALNEIKRRVLQLVQLLLWGGSLYLILGFFPQTRFMQLILQVAVKIPLQLLLIAIGSYVLIRISAIIISRILWELEDSRLLSPEASKRLILRISTFSQVLKRISAILIILTGVLLSLTVIGIPVGPILAGAGIFGLAISFASQSVIKDAINGLLILLEDQYGVGDVIEVGTLAGLVENMDLRITQLRDAEGCLITIPNGDIRAVKNRSKEWSRVDLNIPVPYGANLPQVMRLVETVAIGLSQDFQWKGLILEPPQLMGVDDFSDRGVILKVWIKTQPLKQWDVAREYRRRLKAAFDQKGIPIAIPQRDLWVQSFPPSAPSSNTPAAPSPSPNPPGDPPNP